MKEWWGQDVLPRIRGKIVRDHLYIREGEVIPNGYGIAYYEPGRDQAVCYPIPVNLIVGAWRSFKWHLMCPPWRFTEWKEAKAWEWRRERYMRGYSDGLGARHRAYGQGFADGQVIQQQLYDREQRRP